MEELLRSNDLVFLTFVMHLLDEAEIDYQLLDSHMSAVEGSIGAIPRRLVVADGQLARARRVLSSASLTISDE
jgi:hypothetical protein